MSTIPRYPEHHPDHPRQLLRPFPGNGLFITATNTSVGKTTVTAALAAAFRSLGSRVGVCKPVASGCPPLPDIHQAPSATPLLDPNDAYDCPDAILAARMAGLDPYDRTLLPYIAPVRLAAPVSPHLAAQIEQRPIDWHRIASALDWWQENCDILLVEGAGGWLVPLDHHDFMIADLASALRLPVLLVTTPDLGTLNHTLLTVHSIRERGLTVAGIVINRTSATPDFIEQSNLTEIPRLSGVPVRAILPTSTTPISDRIPDPLINALLPFAQEWRNLNPIV